MRPDGAVGNSELVVRPFRRCGATAPAPEARPVSITRPDAALDAIAERHLPDQGQYDVARAERQRSRRHPQRHRALTRRQVDVSLDGQPHGEAVRRECRRHAGRLHRRRRHRRRDEDRHGGQSLLDGRAGPGIVRITSPAGKLLGTINLPIYGGEPKRQTCSTNEAFGGPDGRTLFIAGCDSVYTIQLKTPGIVPAHNVK